MRTILDGGEFVLKANYCPVGTSVRPLEFAHIEAERMDVPPRLLWRTHGLV